VTSPDFYPQEPADAPNWAFSPDHDVRCPECDAHLSGLNWITDGTYATGMSLVPCGHELSTQQWELVFSGRAGGERRYGNIIRTPSFVRKDT
jgi:hypothetical protein